MYPMATDMRKALLPSEAPVVGARGGYKAGSTTAILVSRLREREAVTRPFRRSNISCTVREAVGHKKGHSSATH